jgi:endoglucanase
VRQRRIDAQNPLAGRPWGVYEGDGEMAWAPYERASGETKQLLGKIALAPKAKWFGGWISDAEIADKVRGYVASSQQQAGSTDALVQMSIFRMHPWEDEACHRLPTPAESASYRTWIERFASAVGDAHAAIILQPDGPFALCAPRGSRAPSDLIAFAARTLSALPNTSVYIDVGAADWPIESQGGVPAATRIAIQDGVRYARGIALNTTHYSSTIDEVERGADVVRALATQGIADKHFVVNTSSNGKGFVFGDYRAPDPDNARVCASQQDPGPCVALGIPPTYDFADPEWGLPQHTVELAQQYADAFLWIGRPWLYDQNEPFVESRALTLARVSRW